MKIDRFVKVMLVLIAVLLALNCAKDLSLSSNSRSSSSNVAPNSGSSNNIAASNASGGSSSPSVFESSVEAAAPPSFFQVGKIYETDIHTFPVKVLRIDNSGWMYVEVQRENLHQKVWVNTNQMKWAEEK